MPKFCPKSRGGRFATDTHALVEAFNASIAVDKTMYREDIAASRAHVYMLAQVGILEADEAKAIQDGLHRVEEEIATEKMEYSAAQEDIHMHVEARLTQLIGAAGKKLHTGRSRNDQVATDMRLYTRNRIDEITTLLVALMGQLLQLAEREQDTILPGFTHLQIAQPVTFAHHMLAWLQMLKRDHARFIDCRQRVNQLPLGAAALAGTSYPLDPTIVATQLGFAGLMDNSLDAVSDRDFAIEFCAAAATCMMHLSRWCEELVLWSSQLVGFVQLPDAFCTGSSIMPQKKNPDVPELVRGKSSRVFGDLQALLVLMQSQPLAYNKDNQEDKSPLFSSAATLIECLRVLTAMLPELQINQQRMRVAFVGSYAEATDLADYLVGKGVAFRDAHAQVGALVQAAHKAGKELSDLPLTAIQAVCPQAQQDVYAVLQLETIIARRTTHGGTAPLRVAKAIAATREWLHSLQRSPQDN